jgi:hypothetical protein
VHQFDKLDGFAILSGAECFARSPRRTAKQTKRVMKRILAVAGTVLCLALFSAPAFAAGISPIDSSVAGEGGYSTPTAGANPHGGYSAATNKCQVCHAVHGAAPSGQALLRTAVETPAATYSMCSGCHPFHGPPPAYPANTPSTNNPSTPCVYCHVSGPFAITKVYGGDANNYWMESTAQDYENNHASNHGFDRSALGGGRYYEGCPSCHSVHGANVWSNAADGISYDMILRTSPGPSLPAAVSTLDDFCRDCHDGSQQNGATGVFCGSHCHNTAAYSPTGPAANTRQVGLITASGSRNGVSHIMTSTLTNAAGADVSHTTSEHCTSCHKGGNNTPGNSFPHLTSGVDFLADSYVATSHLDQVCLECHDDGAGGAFGVGRTF